MPGPLTQIGALLGLIYSAGVGRANHVNTLDLWKADGIGIEAFGWTMGISRFKFLLSPIRFD